MLTIRENLLETIRGGKPDRFVNQYEYLELIPDPILLNAAAMANPGETKQNDWGYWISYPEGMPGPMPDHDPEKILIKDINNWRQTAKAPDPNKYSAEEWAPFEGMAAGVDRKDKFVATFVATGLFEKLHYMMGMDKALVNFVIAPKAMHELIDYLTDWEIECAKVSIAHIHPDALFHHDDWGSQTKSFLSPKMFKAFFEAPYKKIYSFWKQNGVEVVVHHSDSYAANLVPSMIEMGVDIYQGAVSDNNIPKLLQEYGGKISIHGGMDNGKYDAPEMTREKIHAGLKDLIDGAGTKYLIPGLTMGGPGSIYPGVYEMVSEEIDALSKEYF